MQHGLNINRPWDRQIKLESQFIFQATTFLLDCAPSVCAVELVEAIEDVLGGVGVDDVEHDEEAGSVRLGVNVIESLNFDLVSVEQIVVLKALLKESLLNKSVEIQLN